MRIHLLTILLAALAASHQGGLPPEHPDQLQTPPLQPFVPPQPVRLTLGNGASLLVIESNELPLVDGTLLFRTNRMEEKQGRAGLNELLCDVLREGGSRRTTGSELDDWLDSHAASISIESTPDALRINFSCVESDMGTVLVFLGELLMIPAYPQEELDGSRARLLTRLALEQQAPNLFADRMLDSITLRASGSGPLQATEESVRAISRTDLLEHHRKVMGADRLLVGVTGAVDPNSLAARLDSLLSKLRRVGPQPKAAPAVFHVPGRTTIYLVDRPGTSHCEVRIAGPGTRRLDRDYPPLYLWSYAVGYGGSTNRLMVRLRTELGLIFDGSLYYRPEWNRAGRMLATCSTRVESVGDVLGATIELLHQAKEPMEEGELESVKRRVLSSELFEIDSPEEVLQRALDLELQGYPSDFWERRDEHLRGLTPGEVALAVGRHLEVDRLVVLVVGPAEVLEGALAGYGDVVRLEGR